MSSIKQNVKEILKELPEGVALEAACKMRTPHEIQEAVEAGINIIGENYMQEAEEAHPYIKAQVRWHFIGHLQTNKVKRAVKIFDMIESIDSLRLAKEIDKESSKAGKVMECLVEINSAREKNKYGVFPEETEKFIEKAAGFKNIKILGLMTMGPLTAEPEQYIPYFKTTQEIFDDLKKKNFPGCEMEYLSMGMSNSYRIAVDQGANLVRIGTRIFGPRE
jgi:pyridoxal phosphate enzyme (YggS family)